MTSFNEPERNLAAEAREREERENHPTATRSRSPGAYRQRICQDCGHEMKYHAKDKGAPCPTNSYVAGRVMNHGGKPATSDMGHESPWKPVSELPLDQDALVATVVVVRRKKAHQVRLAVAYHTVSNTWRTESWVDPVREFEEYMVIPK